MAFLGNKVLLGYEDEAVNDRHKDLVDFTTNKVGGKPDWMCNTPPIISCKTCGLNLPLIIQIYAPIKNSSYHRTLYIFACVNPKCWNSSDSWVCLRDQKMESRIVQEDTKEVIPDYSWCTDSDNWGDEENGNLFDSMNNQLFDGNNRLSDENRLSELSRGMSEMSVDDNNANFGNGSTPEGATGTVPLAVAMIEGDEGEVVCVETPTTPQDNLVALLEQAMALPQIPDSKLEFSSFFISVDEEDLCRVGVVERDTLLEKVRGLSLGEEEEEVRSSGEHYEKSLPAHGDKMFHQFLTKIQANPGQIIRYGGYPLWLYPEEKRCMLCRYCGSEAAFELQILPTLVSKLVLSGQTGHLEFGSVFLFSCLRSCWDPQSLQPRVETLIVQKENL